VRRVQKRVHLRRVLFHKHIVQRRGEDLRREKEQKKGGGSQNPRNKPISVEGNEW